MSQDNDKISPDDGDSQVSDLYRELAAERPSKAMDRGVLEEAASAAVTRKYWSSAWFRPLAFVTTVALSFAVVLEISRVDQLEAPASQTSEAAKIQHASPPEDEQMQAPIAGNDATFRQRKSSAADSPAVDSTPLQLKEAEPPGRVDSKVETKNFADDIVETSPLFEAEEEQMVDDHALGRVTVPSPPAPERDLQDGTAAIEVDSRNDLEEAAAVAAKRMRDTQASQAMRSSAAAESQPTAETMGIVSYSSALDAAPVQCSEEVRSAVASWWQCIEALRDGGDGDLADYEFEQFQEAFPDYRPAN